MEATVLTNMLPGNPVYHEEFFGPVAVFFTVTDEQAAIDLANDSPFGLGGSVFTQDIARGKRVAEQIDTGMVFINSPDRDAGRFAIWRHQRFGLRQRTFRIGHT